VLIVEALSLEVIQWRTRTLKRTREKLVWEKEERKSGEDYCRRCST
jgi:hypothetical protein